MKKLHPAWELVGYYRRGGWFWWQAKTNMAGVVAKIMPQRKVRSNEKADLDALKCLTALGLMVEDSQ